jgi:hypothetical protein
MLEARICSSTGAPATSTARLATTNPALTMRVALAGWWVSSYRKACASASETPTSESRYLSNAEPARRRVTCTNPTAYTPATAK